MKIATAAVVALALVVGAVSFATANIVNNEIHACVNRRTRALQWDRCKPSWRDVHWDMRGQKGPRGPRGWRGPQGVEGAQGPPGQDGIGTEIVEMVSHYSYDPPTNPNSSNAWFAAITRCPPGDIIVGGGYSSTTVYDVDFNVQSNHPWSSSGDQEGWRVEIVITDPQVDPLRLIEITTYARCLKP